MDEVLLRIKSLCVHEKLRWTSPYNSHDEYFHVVCGISDEELWLITAYRPSVEKWESDLKTRKVDS